MLVVTTDQIYGWDVQRVCGEVFGLSLRARSESGSDAERALVDSRAEVISRMLEHARAKGGNAVVGLRFDAAALGEGSSELCAYGTAIVAVPVDHAAQQTASALGYGRPDRDAEDALAPTQLPEGNREGTQQYTQQQGHPGYRQYPSQGDRAR